MDHYMQAERKNLMAALSTVAPSLKGTPVYRAVCPLSFKEYLRTGLLMPTQAFYSDVIQGGVHFYFDPEALLQYNRLLVVVSTLEALSKNRHFLDTRIPGHDKEIIERLERMGNGFNGWDVWQEVIKNDTITAMRGPAIDSPRFVYSRRNPVNCDEIYYEIFMTDFPKDQLPEGCDLDEYRKEHVLV